MVPASLNVSVGEIATFRCQHSDSNTADWNVNGTLLRDYHPPNITKRRISFSGVTIHELSIQAYSIYNKTIVECVAFIFSDNSRQHHTIQRTPPARLLIQGMS